MGVREGFGEGGTWILSKTGHGGPVRPHQPTRRAVSSPPAGACAASGPRSASEGLQHRHEETVPMFQKSQLSPAQRLLEIKDQ